MKRIITALLISLSAALAYAGGTRQDAGSAPGSGPAAITVEVFDRGTGGGTDWSRSNPANNNWTQWIQEKLLKDENIAVNFVTVPRSEEVAGLNNMLAAGNAPDICLTYSSELITHYQSLGGLFDMAPYIDSLLKDLKAYLGPDPSLPGRYLIARKQDRATGAVYAIPGRRTILGRHNTFIRKDWLDKLGLPPPSTTEEFFNDLMAFKEKDPGGAGKDRVIPFGLSKAVQQHAGILLGSFVDPNLSVKERWINTVGEFEFLLPGQKEGFRFLNRMYNAGLIDRDFPLYPDKEASYNVVKAGLVGSFGANWDVGTGFNIDLRRTVPAGEIVAIDPFKNAAGKTVKSVYDPEGIYFFVPKSSKAPEAALRYANWLGRPENYTFLQAGPEGIVHDKVNGLPKIKMPQEIPPLWIQNSGYNMDYTFNINGVDLGDPGKNARMLTLGNPDLDPKYILEAYDISMRNPVPVPVIIPSSPLTASGPYMQTLTDKAYVLMAAVITARPVDFDKVWESELSSWLASGAQAVVDERRAKYVAP
ncbi:MAG: extracellular solute-binding protein [Treponema sp.]|nr:extracellular solute-binding protein [Treponema sp.]